MTKKIIFIAVILGLVTAGTFAITSHQALACSNGCNSYRGGNYSYTNCSCDRPTPQPQPIPTPPPVYNPPVYNPPVYNPPVYNPPVYPAPIYNAPVYNPPIYVYNPPVIEQPVIYQQPIIQTIQTYAPLSVTCQANPVNAPVGTTVTWTAIISGGNGLYGNYNTNGYYNNGVYYNDGSYGNGFYNGSGYSLNWTGTDGLGANSSTVISKTYVTPGQKVATVTVYQNGQSVTTSCASFIGTAPIVPSYGPTQRVYLNQVPYTGEGSVWKVSLFLAVLLAWSALVAWVILKRRNAATSTTARLAAAGIVTTVTPVAETSNANFLNNYVAKLRGQSAAR